MKKLKSTSVKKFFLKYCALWVLLMATYKVLEIIFNPFVAFTFFGILLLSSMFLFMLVLFIWGFQTILKRWKR